MFTWILRLIGIGFLCLIGLGFYQTYEKGYLSIPDIETTDYAFSHAGFRGIYVNADVSDPIPEYIPDMYRRLNIASKTRRYMGLQFEVQEWMQDAWSYCITPTDEERLHYESSMPEDIKSQLEFTQFEAVCTIDVDGSKVARGLLYSIPKL